MIRKLPPQVAQQIAAGEVIERPASALKELLENSIDSGARRIKVEHQDGGLVLLRVEDDGNGIAQEELPLVFEPHATSKLKSIDDLHSLKSMGFRGEALSSLASVSRIELWSAQHHEDVGSRIQVAFGQVSAAQPADRRQGTEIKVRDLFQTTPARLRFLKGARAEARRLMKTFRLYCLGFADRNWEFQEVGSKQKLQVAAQSAQERVHWFFDVEDPEQWFSIRSEQGDWKLRFFSAYPRYFGKYTRGSYVFLNGRPIRDRHLEFALRRAFEGYTETPNQMSAALFLESPLTEVDINVHPTKQEVRFQKSEELFSWIVRSIRKELEGSHHRRSASVQGVSPMLDQISPQSDPSSPVEEVSTQRDEIQTQTISFGTAKGSHALKAAAFSSLEVPYEYVGALSATYLLAKKDEELYVFDQHALHERILYEQFWFEYQKQKILRSQRLLFPVSVSFEGVEELLEHEKLLESLGFEVREWKGEGLQLLAAPAMVRRNHSQLLRQIWECRESSKESLLRDSLATIACHSAVRAHDPLQAEEAQQLLKQFHSQDALGHCPHGRPTFVRFCEKDFEKYFHRT